LKKSEPARRFAMATQPVPSEKPANEWPARWLGTAVANPQDCVEDGSIHRFGGPTSANFSPVRSTITQLSGSTHFPNTRGVASGLTAGFSFVVGFDIGANS
jgi:hypothetical protein